MESTKIQVSFLLFIKTRPFLNVFQVVNLTSSNVNADVRKIKSVLVLLLGLIIPPVSAVAQEVKLIALPIKYTTLRYVDVFQKE